jgi:phenylacetate-CoA ligase
MTNILHKAILWEVVERRNKIRTKLHQRFLKKSEVWSADRIHDFQWKKLQELLTHAYQNTDFYKNRFDALGMKPSDIQSFDDFHTIPPLTRKDLNEFLQELVARNVPEQNRLYSATGGSTGLPTRFVLDTECIPVKKASEYRFNTFTGWEFGGKILAYWPALADFTEGETAPHILKSTLYYRHAKLFAGRLNDEILTQHAQFLSRYRPHLIRAFPSALEKFSEWLKNHDKRVPSPDAIICVGEPLLGFQRDLFKEIFKCDVFNCYVSRECGNIACECKAHNGLHIAEELLYLEVEKSAPGDFGEILLTDLWNRGMPLIRYRIQDAANWIKGNCSCGRTHRRIGVEAARISDFLVSPVDGAYVSGSTLTHYLLAEGPDIRRTKIVQDSRDHITVTVAGQEGAVNSSVEHIRKRINTVFDGMMRIDFKFVDDIPLLESGKYSFVERKYQLE